MENGEGKKRHDNWIPIGSTAANGSYLNCWFSCLNSPVASNYPPDKVSTPYIFHTMTSAYCPVSRLLPSSVYPARTHHTEQFPFHAPTLPSSRCENLKLTLLLSCISACPWGGGTAPHWEHPGHPCPWLNGVAKSQPLPTFFHRHFDGDHVLEPSRETSPQCQDWPIPANGSFSCMLPLLSLVRTKFYATEKSVREKLACAATSQARAMKRWEQNKS